MSNEELNIFLQDETSNKKKTKYEEPAHTEETKDLIKELRSFKSKDAGLNLLQQQASTRAKLVMIARDLDLPVSKRDTVEQLSERIIDTTIGYRTRSAAIRGNDPEPESS